MLANTRQTLDQSLDISDSEELKCLRLDQANYKCCAMLRQNFISCTLVQF